MSISSSRKIACTPNSPYTAFMGAEVCQGSKAYLPAVTVKLNWLVN